MKQTITALYDSREYANNAALMLRQAGVAERDITISPETAVSGTTAVRTEDKGFWASLEDMFGGTSDHATYAEGVRRGGILLTAHIEDTEVDDAITILEKHGSVDLDERETNWRNEGWAGETAIAPLTSKTSYTGNTLDTESSALGVASTTAPLTTQPIARTTETPVRAGVDDVVQVVEERLDIGKRIVNRGKVRLHTYVVENKVSENVTLRDETVTIERRPVDRALGVGEVGADAFRERTIEVDEMDEEAVVGKSARVVEEIGIRKDVTDRVQTVSDTVRSTKVDIEDGRVAGGARTGVMGDFAARLAPNMDVVGSDGQHVGVIDHVDGGMIKLKKMDSVSGGQHHLIPTDWIASVDSKVTLKTSAADAKSRWTSAG